MATTTKKKAPAKSTAAVKAKRAPAKKPAATPKTQQATKMEYPTRVQALVVIFVLLSVTFAVVAYSRY